MGVPSAGIATKAQDALRASEERYPRLETANEGIWTIDANSIRPFS